MSRKIALLTVLLVAVAGAWLYWQTTSSGPPKLRTVAIEQRDLRIAVTASGTLEPDQIVEVSSLTAGTIVQFGRDIDHADKFADVGSRVTEGSLLVQIDSGLFQVAQQKAEAALRLAAAELGRLESQLQQAQRDLQRAERLRDTNSQSDFDKSRTAYDMASAEREVGRARLEQARAEAQQAKINLHRTTIRSPIDGVIIDRRANLGQNVGSSTSSGLFLIAKDLSQMRVRATVSEADIGKIYIDQPVEFYVDAYRDQTFVGRVRKILLNARIHNNVVNYDVLVGIDNYDARLLPHMTANLSFEIVRRENAQLVLTEALQWWPEEKLIDPHSDSVRRPLALDEKEELSEGDVAVVWAPAGDGQVRPIEVRIGIDDGVHTEVVADELRDGMPIVVGTTKRNRLARIIPKARGG
ncbi:MAG: efflux RND transporter periplasmic adaptor subunit [Pirellulales bacterium]